MDNLFQVLRTAFEQLMSEIRQCSCDGKLVAYLGDHRVLGALSRQSYPGQLRVVASVQPRQGTCLVVVSSMVISTDQVCSSMTWAFLDGAS